MKHLKTYEKASINGIKQKPVLLPQFIIDELRDICLELTDTGLIVNLTPSGGDYTYMGIYKQLKSFIAKFTYTNEIQEVIDRMQDYLLSQGFFLKTDCGWIRIGKELYHIGILFYLKHPQKFTTEKIKTYESNKQKLRRIILPIEIINELRDICLELQDDGFIVGIYGYDNRDGFHYDNPTLGNSTFIQITRPANHASVRYYFNYFKCEEISEVIERIKDYMNGMGYNTELSGGCKDSTMPKDQLVKLRIFFSKKQQIVP